MTAPRTAFDQILGHDPQIDNLRRIVRKAAESRAHCILIYGETGTGKGLVAQAIHELSPRADGPFLDVNCGAIPAELVESELFGHERGAFTGATSKKIGLVEAADAGTLFLDEIRELSPVLQAKLLTLIDTQRFRRIGSVQPIKVDVRFIAATNRILFSEVREGRFREDLYYRLQIIAINLPPLRDRGEDIPFLARHFLCELSARYGRPAMAISPESEEIFRRYHWPGNVRELQHMLERIVALEETSTITPAHIPARVLRETEERARLGAAPREAGEAASGAADFQAATRAFQTRLIRQALARANGNVAGAAEALGLSRHALRHQMLKLGLPASS